MTKYERWKRLSRRELSALYERYTMTAIAAMFGLTHGAVAYRLRTWGLSARLTGKKHSPGPKREFTPPREELERLYRKMSMRDVAAHYGVGETVIFTRIKEAGIPLISRSERLTGKRKSPAHVANLSRAKKGTQKGDKNPNWRGGVASVNQLARSSPEYRAWKEAVLARASYKCQKCGIEQGSRCKTCGHVVNLHVHHVEEFARSRKRRHDLTNGRALCDQCHRIEHYAKTG